MQYQEQKGNGQLKTQHALNLTPDMVEEKADRKGYLLPDKYRERNESPRCHIHQ